jgi:NAD(P)-dependent dehydrogenase (short-subunit alcohol dehydrogenase family)
MIEFNFNGRVALVTGGSSGIGLATVNSFAHAGASVVIAARNREIGQKEEARLIESGAQVCFIETDVRDDNSVSKTVNMVIEKFGRLDYAVNSAGIGGNMAPLDKLSLDVWDDVMATNTRGVFLSMRYEVAAMLRSGGGAIVNICSVYGMVGRAAHHGYVASKHAVLGMTKSVALEVATQGIRVNTLCAGATRTPAMILAENHAPEVVEKLVSEHPMARMASEKEMAQTVIWLCSDSAGFITGAPILADGGFVAA